MTNSLKKVEVFYNNIAPKYDFLKKKNSYYHQQLSELYKFLIPPKKNVIEIGCATGDLIALTKPLNGVGIDISEQMITIAKKKHSKLKFEKGYAEKLNVNGKFDYIILSDLVGILDDIQQSFDSLHKISNNDTRIIVSFYNYFWEPFLLLAEKIGLKTPQPLQSWLSSKDIKNLLELSGFEVIKASSVLLIPIYIPFISHVANKYLARLPLIRKLCFINYLVARKQPMFDSNKEYSVSIVLPARNEAGNIERAVKEIPDLGKKTQLIFVEDHSKDNTREVIADVIKNYKGKKEILFLIQKNEYGKVHAVRRGLEKATGDIVIIFDSDLSNDPSDLPKFYRTLRDNKAEFVQGSRLVYPMEKQAMRVLNVLGNKFFSMAFTFLLDQQIKDTLCGTKGMFKHNYNEIVKNRAYFGDFDPFGDFDLIFGSSKLNLKILEIPIRYKARSYGKSNISRFKHGWLLFKMTIIAAKKIKFF